MKGVLLLSDGIDSPVAGHLMLRKMDLIFLSFIQEPKMIPKIKKNIEILKTGSKLLTIDHNDFQKKVRKNCNIRYQCILCKRRMYREAEKIARENNAEYIVTGENIGQVASQTLINLSILDNATTLPVLRPLLGFDKNETIVIAKEIGTYDISIADAAKCPYVPKNPTTQGSLDKIKKRGRRMQTGGIYIRYTLLGIASAVIYGMRLSNLLDKITAFVFLVSVFVVVAMIGYVYYRDLKFIKESSGGERPGHEPDMKPKTALVFGKVKKLRVDRYHSQTRYLGRHSTDILKGTSITIVGLGNIGKLTAELFVRAGVGRIVMFDDGIVTVKDKTYDLKYQGKSRALATEEELYRINSEVSMTGHNVKLTKDNIQLIDTHMVLDCTNDFYTKLKLNEYCKKNNVDYFLATSIIKRVRNDSECIECFTRHPKDPEFYPDLLMGSALAATEIYKAIFGRKSYDLITYSAMKARVKTYKIPEEKLCSVCDFRK